ncbi:MAG: TatD family hydrolase [Gammaproteobacteria bacterium]|nr:TatD family hydrolase [Gammaproteobacteria bacterium]
MLIDSHCHLNHLKKLTPDQAVSAAIEKGVKHMLSICVERSDIDALKEIVNAHPEVCATLGIHPCDVHNHSLEDLDFISNLMTEKKSQFIGIGETGLDYYYTKEHEVLQKKFFQHQILLAKKHECPLIVHSRSAPEDTVNMLKEFPHNKVIIHCFTESLSMAKACLDLGAYISFSGIISFKNALELKEVVKYVPLDRMLIETDSPYLAPVPHRGHENQPAYVYYVAQAVADLKSISFDDVANVTTNNFKNLFGWPKA